MLRVRVINDMRLDAAGLGREVRPIRTHAAQGKAGRIDQIGGVAEFVAQAPPRAPPSRRKARRKPRWDAARWHRTASSASRHMTAHMVQPCAVALQAANNLAQAHRPGKLPIEQRDELVLGGQMAHMFVRTVILNMLIKYVPRNALQQIMKYAIVMPHSVAPLPYPNRRKTLGCQ